MKVVVILQARMSSSRLPGKVLMPIQGKPALLNIAQRITRSKRIDDFYIATSEDPSDDVIEEFAAREGLKLFRGSLNNVLERYYICAKNAGADIVIRCTADNNLIDPDVIDESVDVFERSGVDYLSYKASLPDGMRVEVFTFAALEKAYNEAKDPECIEHVTPYIIKNTKMFKVLYYKDDGDVDNSYMRFTMDTPEDYKFVTSIYAAFGRNDFTYSEVLQLLKERPELLEINNHIQQVQLTYNGE